MTPEEEGLLARIAAFRFDDGSPKLSFAARLARDNGWRRLYALRVIEEYRKFAFLMVASGHMAVPSDQVDQAWRQHLFYTRSWLILAGVSCDGRSTTNRRGEGILIENDSA